MVDEESGGDSRWHWLRRGDQAVAGMLLICGLIACGGLWIGRGGLNGESIDIDRSRPLPPFQFLVDINSAEAPELMLLPGIGETLARRIVQSREQHGPFADVGDLERVKGIGPRTMDRLRPYLLPIPPAANVAEQ